MSAATRWAISPTTCPRRGIAFVGDSLFALGCGRMFEGTAPQFWASLSRLKALPPETTLYCAHEYTQANASFALHADPDNAALKAYCRRDRRQARRRAADRADAASAASWRPTRSCAPTMPEMQARWGGGDRRRETFAAFAGGEGFVLTRPTCSRR